MSRRRDSFPSWFRRGGILLAALLVVMGTTLFFIRDRTHRNDRATPSRERPSVQLTDTSSPGATAGHAAMDTASVAELVPMPTEDLELVGLFSTGGARQAMFALTTPERAARRFSLTDGEQNEWLAVRTVDLDGGTVNAILKKAVVRNRNVGVEVLFTLKAKERAAAASGLVQ